MTSLAHFAAAGWFLLQPVVLGLLGIWAAIACGALVLFGLRFAFAAGAVGDDAAGNPHPAGYFVVAIGLAMAGVGLAGYAWLCSL